MSIPQRGPAWWSTRPMKVRSRRVLCMSTVILSVLAASSQARAQLAQEAFARMPRSTVASIVMDNARQTRDRIMNTGVVRAVTGEEFSEFRNAINQKGDSVVPWIRDFPLPQAESERLLADGCFAVAVVETEAQLPEQCFLVELGSHGESWLSLIGEFTATSAAQGATVEKKSVLENDLWLVSATTKSRPTAIARTKGWLIVGETEACVMQWLDVSSGDGSGSSGLTSRERYAQTVDQLAAQIGDRGDLWIYVDPLRLDYLHSRAGGENLDSFSDTFGSRHGFDAIRALGGMADFGDKRYDASYRFKVWAPPPHERGMQLIELQAMSSPEPSSWIPDLVSSCTTMNWNLQTILGNVGPLVDEVIRETIGTSDQTFDVFLAEVRSDQGPGIDLATEFMPLLGPRIEYISIFTPPASETAEQSIAAIEVSDDAAVADLLYLLLEPDSNNVPLTIEGFPFELWKLGMGKRAGDRGVNFSTPGIMVAHGKLFFASSYSALRQHVAVKQQMAPLVNDSDFQQLSDQIASIAGETPAVRIIAYPARDFENTYELLRTGRAEQAASLYASLLQPALQGGDTELPFELLPDFAVIRDSFGPACIQINRCSDGWELWGLNLRADSGVIALSP